MFNKKLSIRTQQEEVAELTSFGDKGIFQINTSNNITSNSLIFEVQENNAKIKLYNDTNDTSEILSFNNTDITISSNVTINNNLNVSNLNVYGTTTTINTSTYETENLEIINTQLDAPSLKIQQSYESTNPNNILDVGSLNSSGTYEQKMVLDTDGNLNISGNINFDGNLTNSGNVLIYNENSLKTFLSGKNVTTLNLSLNGEIKINDQAKKFHWSYDIDKSDISNSIYYSDTNSLSDISGIQYGTAQLYKSHVNITANIGEGKYTDNLGFLIQNRQRTNAIGFGYNTISQVGNDTNGYLNIKSKGNLPVSIGNETNNMFFVFNDKVGVGISSPTRLFQVGENSNTGTSDQVIALSQEAGTYIWELSMSKWNKYSSGSGGSGKYDLEIKPNSTNDNTAGNLGNILLMPNINVGIGTTTPSEKLHVNGNLQTSGILYVNGGTLYAKNNNYMQTGSLNIGSIDRNYGGGTNWNSNTAGLLLECLNHTEIAVHDSGTRLSSLMHFEGASNNSIKIGRDMGWGTISKIILNGNIGIGTDNPQYKLSIYQNDSSGWNSSTKIASWYSAFGIENQGGHGVGMSFKNNQEMGYIYYGNSSSWVGQGAFGIATETTGAIADLKFVIQKDGDIGIGIISPTEKLTITGNSTGTITSLGLRNGNDATTFNNGAQISFGWNGANEFKHFIHTRHNNANNNNAIDFYLCDGTQNNTVTSGSVHTMSLVSGNVGINNTNPTYNLDVTGDIHFTGNLYKNSNLFEPYTDNNVVSLLSNGSITGIFDDLTFLNLNKFTFAVNDPQITPTVTVNNIGNGYKTVIFQNPGTGDNQTIYNISFTENVLCDILIVGGGGGGGAGGYENGGGGGGGVLYMTNKVIQSGVTYKISVGDGGASNTSGYDSTITYSDDTNVSYDGINMIGKGGGTRNANGGSGGGGANRNGNQTAGNATQGNTFWNGIEYVPGGFDGGPGGSYNGGGGGGAGAIGERSGGDGRQVNITGTNVYYGGGGGASPGGDGGLGGGGGTGGWGSSGQAGTPHTGGGGGAYYSISGSGGKGGSGIIVLKYYSVAIETFNEYSDDKVKNVLSNLDTHIIPTTNETIDIGSVDKKIRDIYVSNNSIWIGDSHKLMVTDEKLKFKKRNKNVIPTKLSSLITDADISLRFSGRNKSDLSLHEWLEFAKEKDPTIETINEVFEDNDTNYEEQTNIDFWLSTGNNIYLHGDYQNIGIGITNPLAKLSVHSLTQGDGILISENNALLGKNSSNDKTQLMFWNGSQVFYGRVSSDEGSSLGVTAHNFITGTTGITTMRIVDNTVGIGINSPKSVLNVHNTLSSVDLNIRTANSGSTVFNTESLWLGKGDSNNDNYWGLSLGTIWTGSSYIQAVNTDENTYYNLMLQPHGGNVGINNQNPAYTLDVTGDIKFTGQLYQGNSLFTSYTDTHTTNLINTGVVGILKLTSGDTISNSIVDKIEIESYFSTYGSGSAISFKNRLNHTPEQEYISARIKSISDYANDGSITPDNYYSGHLIFETQFGDSTNTNGVARNTTERMRITNRGNIGIGTTNPTYKLDVNGDINYTGRLLKNGSDAAASGTIYKGMIVEMKHYDYKKMKYAAPAEWSPIDNDLSTGFIISIKPKSLNSLISLFVNCYISFDHTDDSRWWGARLYRKVGNGNWTHVTSAGGNRTGDDADDIPSNSGTAVWFGDNNLSSDHVELGNCSATYLDTPNTLETVYYTVYWKCRLGDSDPNKYIALNRSISHDDAYRAEPISSWTVKEIWNDGNPYLPIDTTISISADNVGINNTNPQYELDVVGSINFTGDLKQNGSLFTSFNDQDAINLLNTGFGGGLKVTSGNVGIGTTTPDSILDIIPSVANSFLKINNYGHILINNGNSNNRWTIANRDTGVFSIATDTTTAGNDGIIEMSNDKLTILTNGNVGIGTTTPSKKLHVNGDVNISGTLTTANLDVIGTTTTINTVNYTTENLEIINTQSDGPSLSILQNNNLNNIIDTSNLLTDKKFIVDKDGLVGINIIPTTELDVNGTIKFSGNINNVSSQSLDYIQNLDEDIITKITQTSNLLDNKSSNFTNTIYNELNNKIDNLNVDGSQIISGFVNATSIPIDNSSLYIDNGLLKVNTNNNNTELNTFIGKYEKTEEYIEAIDTVSNSVTTVDNRIFYETTTLTSNITITNSAPKFFTSQTIYPRNIYNRTENYTSTINQWIEGIYSIITNSSDGVFNNNYDTYGSHKVFSHNLTEFYKSSQVFDVSGNYIGSNNFKGTIGLSISIDIGRLIYLRTLKLFPNSSTFNTAMPNNFKIYASNDVNCWGDNSHSSWNLLHNNIGLLQYKPNEFTVFGNFDNLLTKYRYFTLVVTNINGNNTHLELNELSIIGVDDIINQPISIDNETNTYVIKLEYDEVVSEPFSEVTIDGTNVSNYNSTNNLTIYNDSTNVSLTFNTQSIVYDVFDTFNTTAEWDLYAQSLGGSTYFNEFYTQGPFASSNNIGYITFPLPNEYNYIVVEFDKTFTGGRIQVLLNNTAVLTTATGVVNNVIYTSNYTENTTFKFQEIESGVLPRNLKITLINKKEYTLNFSDTINAKVNYNDQLLDTQYTLISGNFDTTNRIINTIIKKTSDNSIIYQEETLSLTISYLKTKFKQEYNILPPYLNSDLDYLYAYYTFENNFNDSKNSYNLINNNNCVINYDNRLYDNCALYLDGTANIEFPDNINLYNIWNDGDGLTISYWFNMHETTQTYGRMLEFAYQTVKYNNESTQRLGIMKNSDDNNSIQIYWKHLNIDKLVIIQLENSYNNWNHLSFSIDKSGYWYIYLNGKLQSIDSSQFQPPNITYNVRVIGRSSYSTSQNFYGYIDDLRFYSKVLDQKEVKILYESIYQTIYTSIFNDIIFADIVLVGGGGSGGGSTGGGGGAGGILYTKKNYIPINNYIFRIGKGGDSVLSDASHNNQDGGNDGINTIAMDTVVFGGGGGGGSKDGTGNPGGSGGGGAFETAFGGSIMTPVYGYVIINGEYYGNVGVSTKNSQISGDGGGGIFNYTINTVSEYYGGAGKGRDSVLNTTTTFDNSTTLGGGGGGGGWLRNTYSGKGGNGIVIIKYYLDKNKTQEYSIETNDDYKVLSGDKVLLNSTLVRRVYNTGDKYFTVFNVEETDIETNIGTITTFVKLNNILKFNIINTIAEHVVYYSNAQNYTKVVIPRNDIYKININAVFNLEFASEFCKFYIKLERLGYEPRYLRVFYLPPISEYSNNDSATLDVTVDLELLVNDIITFESNYKLSVYKESFLTITSTNKTIIDGTLIQNIYNTSANEAFTFESPLNKLGNTITLDQSQLSFNINFAQPLINNNNTVSIQPNYYANYTHNHDASDIVSGQLFLDRIPDLTSRHYSNIVIDDKLSLINTNISNITTYDNSIIKLDYEKIKTPDVEITPVISPELEPQQIYETQTTITEYTVLDSDAEHLRVHWKFDNADGTHNNIPALFENSAPNPISITLTALTSTAEDGVYSSTDKVIGNGSFYKSDAYYPRGYKITTGDSDSGNWLYEYFNTSKQATFAFWVKNKESTYPDQHIFRQDHSFIIRHYGNYFQVYVSSEDLWSTHDLVSTSLFTLNTWVHIVVTINLTIGTNYNDVIKVYQNGIELNTTVNGTGSYPIGTGFINNSSDCIFAGGGSISSGFKGYLDDFRIYDKVLTPTEIGYLANNMIVNPEYKTLTFTYNSANAVSGQTPYTLTFDNPTECDILIVGGGGGGGEYGGGGGGGDVIYHSGVMFGTGNYSIKVGKGGNKGGPGNVFETGFSGYTSEIFLSETFKIIAGGGGGGNSGCPKIKKIKLLGKSGNTSQNADIREFEFGGLGGWGSGNRKTGGFQTNVTTNFSVAQYPATPTVTTQDWVNGSNIVGDPNSLYLSNTQNVLNKYFIFDFVGTQPLPYMNQFTDLKIYWDRLDISTDTEEGTFDLILIDENLNEYTLFTYQILESQLITSGSGTTQIVYNKFNYTYSGGLPSALSSYTYNINGLTYNSQGGGGGGGAVGSSSDNRHLGVISEYSGNGGNGVDKYAGGGGGAEGVGGTKTGSIAGGGGIGFESDITGVLTQYGGGGGGGTWDQNTAGSNGGSGVYGGGNGGRQAGSAPTAGTDGRGGGGGGGGGGGTASVREGANGGSGIVIIRYKTVTFSNKYLSYDFITSKWNTSLLNANDIFIGTLNQSVLPIATTNTLGCIKVDNTTINIDEYGIISSAPAYGDNDVTNYLLNFDTHIIPDTDNAYDIGSVDKRVRELFVSNNSIWMGDTHKIVIKENKMKFKKINKNVIPTRLQSIPSVNADIFSFFNNTITTIEELTLSQWLQYGKSKDNTIETINDVFQDDDNNFEQEISTDIWQTHTNNIILNSDYQNIGIGTSTPNEKLHIIGNTKIEGTLTTSNLDVIGSTTQINTQTYTSESLLIDNTDADGKSITIYHNNANHDIVSIYTNDTNSTEVFTITKTGFIGISHSTPDFPLHIQSSTGKGIRVDCDDIDTEILRFTPNDTYPTSYGGALKYHGSGSGNENKFSITMDNVTGTNIEALSILQNGKTTFSAESIFNDKVGINSGSQTLIVPLQVGPGTNTSAFDSRSSVAILSGDSGGPTELCALSLINSRQGALGTSCSLGFNLSKEWMSSSKIKAISKGTNQSSDLTFETHTGSSLTEKVRICDNGNVGIGTSSPSGLLHIVKTDIDNTIQDQLILECHNNSSDKGNAILFKNRWDNGQYWDMARIKAIEESGYGGALIFETNNGSGSGDTITNEAMRIDEYGNIGIGGVTVPEQKIDMRGSNTRIQIYGNSNTDVAGIRISSNNNSETAPLLYLYANGTSNCCEINSRYNYPIKFLSNNVERMIITNDGKVGIGTMSPAYKLEVSGDINIVGGDFYKDGVLFTGDSSTIWQTNNNNIYYNLGNVGIGTVSPETKLHVQMPNNTYLRVETDTNAISQTSGIEFGIPVFNSLKRSKITSTTHSNDASDLKFYTNPSSSSEAETRMIINQDGNIGINTTNPSYNLDVDGTMRLGNNSIIGSHGKLIFGKRSTTSSSRQAIVGYTDNYEFAIADGTDTNNGQLKIAYSSPSNTIYCHANGNVGIGNNTNPVYKLDVNGSFNCSSLNVNGTLFSSYSDTNFDTRYNTRKSEGLQITGTANNVNTVVSANMGVYSSTYSFIDLRTNSNYGGWIDFGSIAGEDFKVRIRGHNEPRKIEFYTSTNANMILDANGDLLVTGNVTAYYSDERLKTVTENVENVLNTLNNIDVFKYKRNELGESLGIKHYKQEIGLSAQQINKYYPEVVSIAPFDIKYDEKLEKNVSKSGENYLTLNYERLVPILLQGIKELNNKNIELQNQIEEMKKDIEDIKKYINK